MTERPPILQIVASWGGVDEVSVLGTGTEGLRVYAAVLPAIDLLSNALRRLQEEQRPSVAPGTVQDQERAGATTG